MKAFLDGFAKGTGMDRADAEATWAAYSQELSHAERQRVEADGFRAGVREGAKYRAWARGNAGGGTGPAVDRSECRERVCACHDDASWVWGVTYRDGCSFCGCRWAE